MALSEHPGRPGNFWVRASKVKFFWLLAALVGLILAAPALSDSASGEWESAVLGLSVFFAASYVSHSVQRIGIIAVLALVLIVAIGLNIFLGDSTYSRLILFSTFFLILVQTAVSVLSFVLEEGHVGPEHIYGAICAYILIAMSFATMDYLLETLVPGSFSGVHALLIRDRAWWQFFYFSFTTLSTVGYGDIVPVTMRARSFVIIEQLVAVFYVAILIARLTGMYNVKTPSDGDSN